MSKFKPGDKVVVLPSGYEKTPRLLVCLEEYENKEWWSGRVLRVLRGTCDLTEIEYEDGDKIIPYTEEKIELKNFSVRAKNKERITCSIRKA